jgi:hypothetical protein
MHVLLGKFLELVRMKQDPLRVFPKAHFPHRWRGHFILSRVVRTHNREYWQIIADNLSKAGWNWGYVSAVDSNGRTIFVADAHRDNGKRFVVRAEEKLTAFLELERVTRESLRFPNAEIIRHNSRHAAFCPLLPRKGKK